MAEQSEANVIVNVSFSKHNTRDSHLVLRIRIEVCVQGGPQHMRFARPTYVLVKSSVLQQFGQHVECIGVIFAGRRRCQQTRGQIFTSVLRKFDRRRCQVGVATACWYLLFADVVVNRRAAKYSLRCYVVSSELQQHVAIPFGSGAPIQCYLDAIGAQLDLLVFGSTHLNIIKA